MFNVNKCDKEHYDQMYEIHLKSLPINDQMTKQCFYDEFNQPTRLYFVACLQEEVVGYIGVFATIDDYNIIGIAVKEEFQRKNIGTLLLQKVIETAKENNVKSLSLEVDATNNKAIKFYEKHNFKVTNIRKNYYKNNDALIMWLYL